MHLIPVNFQLGLERRLRHNRYWFQLYNEAWASELLVKKRRVKEVHVKILWITSLDLVRIYRWRFAWVITNLYWWISEGGESLSRIPWEWLLILGYVGQTVSGAPLLTRYILVWNVWLFLCWLNTTPDKVLFLYNGMCQKSLRIEQNYWH